MKNFKLPLSLLIAASIFTSCIDDEVSEDVQAIRTAQALNLTADANLTNAEVSYQEALTTAQELANELTASDNAVDIAENEAALVDAQTALADASHALEVAQLENAAAMIAATQLQSANITGTQASALTDYIGALGEVTTEQRALVGLMNDYNELLENEAALVFTNDDAIAANLVDITGLEADIADLEEEKTYLEGVVADPTSAEANALALQAANEELEDEQTDLNAELTQAQDSSNLTFSDDVSDYIAAEAAVLTAEGAVRTAEQGIVAADEAVVAADEAVVAAEEAVVDAEEVVTEKEEELVDLGAAADLELSDAEDARDEANDALTEANDVVTELNNLATEYNAVIAQIATETAIKEGFEATLLTVDANIAVAQAEYDLAQSIFNADATGMTVIDSGIDSTAGEPNDASPDTFREIFAVTTGTPNVYTFVGPNYDSLADIPGGGTEGTAVGEFFNVETDDTAITTEARFTAAVTALTALELQKAQAEANLSTVEAEIAELQEQADEFDATEIDDAIAVQTAAQAAYDLAVEVVTAVMAVETAEMAVETAETGVIAAQDAVVTATAAIETADLALVDAEQDLAEAEADLVDAEALISDAALAEYNTAQDNIDSLEAQLATISDQIAENDADILFYDALTVEFDVTGFDGADYEDRIDAIEERIEEIDAAIIAAQTSIAQEEQENIDLAADTISATDSLAGDIAEALSLIEEKEAEILGLQALAAEYLAILESL